MVFARLASLLVRSSASSLLLLVAGGGLACSYVEASETGLPVAGSLFEKRTSLQESQAPRVSQMLKAEVLRRVRDERDIMTRAVLQGCEEECAKVAPAWVKSSVDPDGGALRWYGFYAAMLIRSSLPRTRAALTNYRLYPKLVPHVDRAEFDEKTRVLSLEGGLWKYRLASQIRFEEIGERWIRFEFVGGHFQGMRGELVLESVGEAGTLVAMRGETFGKRWPPALIVEQGAQIVFSLTGNKMRSFIESQKRAEDVIGTESPVAAPVKKGETHDLPQPRRRLSP
jgi:hypothetical protein